MLCLTLFLSLVFFTPKCHASFSNKLIYPPKKDVYEYWLNVDYKVTMSNHDDEGAHPLYYDIKNETFYQRTPCNKYDAFEGDIGNVIVGDGLHRFVITFNQTVPGPTLIVYQNSTIIVHVHNIAEEPISVHWHGLEMRNAFFMDGVGMVSQCPIMPGQEFTYKFKVSDTPGTYWYHGHTGVNIGDGLYGPLIILSDEDKKYENSDYIAVVSDWFPREASHFTKYVFYENEEYMRGYEDKENCYKMTRDIVGTKVGTWPWNSGVVNGKGWHNVSQLKDALKRGQNVPIEKFLVSSSSKLKPKIRLISASFVYPLIITVSNHRLTVVAIDSYPIEPITVDYIIMAQGERFDVLLEPLENSSVGTHIITAQSIERFDHKGDELLEKFQDHFVAGLIIFDQKKPDSVSFINRTCTKAKPCTVLNCLFESFPSTYNRTCVPLTDIRSKFSPPKVILNEKPDHYEEHFVNMFAEEPGYTLNGIFNVMPSAPLFMNPNAFTKCADDCGFKKKCKCTHIITLTKGNVVEFILYNRPSDVETMLDEGLGHPFHTHGHHFYVLETGWGKYDERGSLEHYNLATSCEHYYCNKAKWNSTNSNIRLKKSNPKPVSKDTIFVPVGGYAVIRFVADNPGWWVAHCHQGPHHAMGMVVILREGKPEEMASIPNDFPVCGYTMKDVKITK